MRKLTLFGLLVFVTFGCNRVTTVQKAETSLSSTGVNDIWFGDPNRPWREVFENFNAEDNGGTNPTLTTSTDPQYGKVWVVHKPSGAKRAEISRAKGYNQREGETIYIGWRWKIDVTNANPTNGITVFQWKAAGNSRQNYPFVFGYNGSTLSLNTYGPGKTSWTEGASIQLRKNTIWKKGVAEGQWVDIVLGVKVSGYDGADLNQKGYIEVWFNGQKQTLTTENASSQYDITLSGDRTRAYHRTNDGDVTYPKWGAYNEGSRPYDVYTYFDELKIGRTYDAAKPDSSGDSNGGNSTSFEIRARGTGGGEKLNFRIDQTTVQTFTLSKTYQTYRTSSDRRGGINVEFFNDAPGRDVQIDYIKVGGQTRQAEAQSYNTGAWGNGRCGGRAYSEWLQCNGVLGFGEVR